MTEYGFENLDSFHTDKYGDTVYYVNDIQVSEDEYNERYDSYVLNYGERIILNTNDGFPFTEENILQCCS